MPNMYDVIARVSWDTNEKELQGLNKATSVQDKMLEELRIKGERLEKQMVKTNDPKKVEAYNKELQATRQQYLAQQNAVKDLTAQQKKLHEALRANNDPKVVQGLLRNLHQVESQLESLTQSTATFGNKMGGIGSNLLGLVGLGAGAFGIAELAGGITDLYNASVREASEAEQGLLRFQQTLQNIGQAGLFDTLVNDADVLAKKYQNLFDNDDILAGQAKFIEGTKVSQEQLQKLIPIAIELAAKLGTDVTTASEMLVNSIIGKTSPELKRLGLDMKGLGDQTSRVNEITGDFATLLAGSVDTALQTAQGQSQQLTQELANLEEQIGTKTLRLQKLLTKLKVGAIEILSDVFATTEDRVTDAVEKKAESFYNILKVKGEKLDKDQLQKSIERTQKEVDYINRLIHANEVIIGQHRSLEQTRLAEIRNEKATVELIERKGKLLAMQRFVGGVGAGKDPLNANAGRDDEAETQEVKKANTKLKKKFEDESKKNPVVISFKLDDDKENLNKQAQAITDNKDKLYKQASDNLSKLNSEQVLGIESVTDADAQELEKQINNRVKANEKKKESDQLSVEDSKQLLYSNTIDLAREAQNQLDIEQNKTDRLIALQEKRVSAAEKNSAVSLKVEQDRLDELLKKRQNYERAQRVIDAAVITANQAVAISGAIATIAKGGNPYVIAANVIAILAGIGAVVGAIRSVDAGYKEGGYTGEGNPNETSTAIGRRPYKYHKKEFVMNEQLTSKNRDMFEGLHRGELMVKQLEDGSYYLTRNRIDTDAVVSDHNKIKSENTLYPLLNEMSSIRKLLEVREVNINNTFDAEGFGQSVATSLGQSQIKFLRR